MEYINYSTKLILNLHNNILSRADRMASIWEKRLNQTNVGMIFSISGQIPDRKWSYLRECSILSLYPQGDPTNSLRFIVPFTIITNYLMELIKREGPKDAVSLNQLFNSIMDAVDISHTSENYYLYHPYLNDNGYLQALVEECRRQVIKNKNFALVASSIKKYSKLYSELQFFKFIKEPYRKEMIHTWSKKYNIEGADLLSFEYFAATDSIIGIVALFTCSLSDEITSDEINKVCNTYFPWICGLHKLLENYLNVQEDIINTNYNLINYYKNLKICEERISFFAQKSLELCKTLKYPDFHRGVIEYFLWLYLSDPRALAGINKLASSNIIKDVDLKGKLNYNLCKLLRRTGKIS